MLGIFACDGHHRRLDRPIVAGNASADDLRVIYSNRGHKFGVGGVMTIGAGRCGGQMCPRLANGRRMGTVMAGDAGANALAVVKLDRDPGHITHMASFARRCGVGVGCE